jgi:hypothetical protein
MKRAFTAWCWRIFAVPQADEKRPPEGRESPGRARMRGVHFLAASTGAAVGMLSAGLDALILPAFTFVALFWFMTLGIPKGHAEDFRKAATRFFLVALPTAWVVYLSVRNTLS